MRPEDDPEQRIRELERPLADAARASELGTDPAGGGHPPIPSIGQGPYGAPYSAAPYSAAPASSTGLRVGWVVFGMLVVSLVIGGAAIVVKDFSSTSRPSTNPSAGPNVSGGGGPFTARTARPTAPTAPIAPPESGGSISVSGIGEAKTVICTNSKVSISGVDNMVTITGHCSRVEVSGVENVVTIESSTSINASGMNNRVTYSSGEPDIDQSGFGNTVERG